jgi:peptide chain release factor 1
MIEQDSSFDKILVLIQSNNNNSETMQEDIKNGYTEFCKNQNWQYNIKKNKNSYELEILGGSAKTYFEKEIGIHKSTNDSDLSCTIYVLNLPLKENISFEEKDIQIQTCRASGAGGQHINTTDSAIKIIHLKSGISTTCQSERSQFQNKQKALDQLKEKVTEFYQKQQDEYINKQRTSQYKSLNLKNETKVYDYSTKTIVDKNKRTILLKDFLNGKNL